MTDLHKYRTLGESMLAYIKNPKHNGIGLAAPQVGTNKRMVVVGLPQNNDDEKYPIILLINPKITAFSPEKEAGEEGCLSLPNLRGNVMRSLWVDAEWLDNKGKKFKKRIMGFGAKVIQPKLA